MMWSKVRGQKSKVKNERAPSPVFLSPFTFHLSPSKLLFLICALFFTSGLFALPPLKADTTRGANLAETKTILQHIYYEKKRIQGYYYKSADYRFYNLLDSVSKFIDEQPIAAERKNMYFSRLHFFLQNINRSYSKTYFREGTYLAILSYYPLMIEWNERDELLDNLNRFSSFSVKAVRLIPNDTVAEDFLTNYLLDNPDDIFRYTEEFDDRKFALSLLENAVQLAPESARRYYNTANRVNALLKSSSDEFVKKSYDIYNRFGLNSYAYLLLDAIVNSEMSMEEADSLGENPDLMFHYFVRQGIKPDPNLSYSIYRFMNNYCVDVMRKINEASASASEKYNAVKQFSAAELFVLAAYGYKETGLETVRHLFAMMQKKTTEVPVSRTLVIKLNKDKLRGLVIYCDKNHILKDLLGLTNDNTQNYLLNLSVPEKKETHLPVLKTFEEKKPVASANQPHQREIVGKKINTDTLKPNVVSEKLARYVCETPVNKMAPDKLTASIDNTVPVRIPVKAIPAPIVETVNLAVDEKTKTLLALKKNILQTIQNIPSFIGQTYADSLLSYAARKEPDELLKKVDDFVNNRFSKRILEECAINSPVSIKRYLYNPKQPVNYILQYSTNPVVKKIFEINPEIGYRSKPLVLLNEILSGKLTPQEAIEVSSNSVRLFKTLVKTISSAHYVGKYSIDHEMRDYSLRFIREINDKIASGGSQPFYAAEVFNSKELYFLMLYGRDEVFTSTFNGLFSRFLEKIPDASGDEFMRSVNRNQFRNFISLCSNFGRLDDFLSRFSCESKNKLLTDYVSNLESEQTDLSTVVLIAEAISNLRDNDLLAALQTDIRKEYERVKAANNAVGISVYGVLSSTISGNAKAEADWYRQISGQFNISPVNLLPSATLLGEHEVCVQQMYFYNDDDGRSSFINFINTYRNQNTWSIEDKKSYVKVYSKTGNKVEILANKPEFDETGMNAISEYLLANSITPSVVIHRGHSFHTESTLEKIPPSAKLVFVGSCGGFYKVSTALGNAPEAHVISTKQIGTKMINDAMLFMLNENIREGKDIVWNDFWQKAKLRFGNNQYFSDYVPPNKNIEAIFIRAYYKLLGV